MKITRLFPVIALALLPSPLAAQVGHPASAAAPAHQLLLPQANRVLPPPRPPHDSVQVSIEKIEASVRVRDHLATTTLTFSLRNPGRRPAESVVLAPVPAAAVLRGFSIDGPGGKELAAELLPRDEARRIYDEIVRRMIDPGLLEFAGSGLIRSSVFPVPAGGTTRARLVYEEVLTGDHGRIDYLLPRTENPERPVPWTFHLDWQLAGGAPALQCPSHPAETGTSPDGAAPLKLDGLLQPGAIRVCATVIENDRPSLSLACYPPAAGEDGTFMLMIAPPHDKTARVWPREVTLVLDRSGSMAGGKLDQARDAALQIIESLDETERFNLIVYNEAVQTLFPAPRPLDAATINAVRGFAAGIRPSGGTNIHDALLESLRPPPAAGHHSVILFLTDGLPTVAETAEKRIREAVAAANDGKRRIFTFGVGLDVNTPLLSRLADDSRAAATFVLPGEDVEMKVLSVHHRLAGPVVADPVLTPFDAQQAEAHGRLIDLVPARLPDVFAGETRIVTGRWRGADPLTLVVRGQGPGGAIESRVTLDPAAASTVHAHVPRLWATRRIAVLTEALRDLGQDGRPVADNDPRARELIDEIVKLSTRHGVLSEFTAFLAREGESFAPVPQNAQNVWRNVQGRALRERSGAGALNQEFNTNRAKQADSVDKSNRYIDSSLRETEIAGVRQLADRTFFLHNGRWTDSAAPPSATPRRILTGTPEFDALVDRLVFHNRQSLLSLPGEILLEDQGETILLTRN